MYHGAPNRESLAARSAGGAALSDRTTEVPLGQPERGLRTAAVVVAVGGMLGLYGLVRLLGVLRPDTPPIRLQGIGILFGSAAFLALIAATLLIHEVLHAIPLALFTRRRPTLGWRLPLYVSIRVPGARLGRNPMVAVLLAPLTVGTAGGLAVLLLGPDALARAAKIAVLLNFIGSVLDAYGAVWLLHFPAATRVEDTPDGPRLYGARADVP